MAGQSAAQPFIDMRDKLYSFAQKYDKDSPAQAKPTADTSWHDSMVKQANEAARKQAAAERQQVGKKAVSKPAKKRTNVLGNKRTARKRG